MTSCLDRRVRYTLFLGKVDISRSAYRYLYRAIEMHETRVI